MYNCKHDVRLSSIFPTHYWDIGAVHSKVMHPPLQINSAIYKVFSKYFEITFIYTE